LKALEQYESAAREKLAAAEAGLDPKLGPLAANGGPTFTMALLSGSPAIDRIQPDLAPPIDQRDGTRPVNDLSDIGAYEFGAAVTVTPTPTNTVLSITRVNPTSIQISGSGTTGVSYFVEASTNLASWQTVATNVSTISFTDSTTNFSTRFYRVTR